MKCFDNLWLAILRRNKVDFLAYLRYVDDSRSFMRGFKKGVRWSKGAFAYDIDWEIEDYRLNLDEDTRNLNILLEAMNSVMSFLKFTGESPADYPDRRLPTLDCSLYVSDGKILHSFFEKSMRADKCLDAKTALSPIVVSSSLRQEIVRRMINMHLDTPLSEQLKF